MTQPQTQTQLSATVTPPAAAPALGPWIGAILVWSIAAAAILRPTIPNFDGFPGWHAHLPLRITALITAALLLLSLFVRTRRAR